MQYTGTSTSPQKKNVSCRRRNQDMVQISHKISGGEFRHRSENQNPPPKNSPAEISPPPVPKPRDQPEAQPTRPCKPPFLIATQLAASPPLSLVLPAPAGHPTSTFATYCPTPTPPPPPPQRPPPHRGLRAAPRVSWRPSSAPCGTRVRPPVVSPCTSPPPADRPRAPR